MHIPDKEYLFGDSKKIYIQHDGSKTKHINVGDFFIRRDQTKRAYYLSIHIEKGLMLYEYTTEEDQIDDIMDKAERALLYVIDKNKECRPSQLQEGIVNEWRFMLKKYISKGEER